MCHASANVRPNPLFDPCYGKEREKKIALLLNGWPHTFGENVFPRIPGDEAGKRLFELNNGRPGKDVNISMALMILQDGFNLTDREPFIIWRSTECIGTPFTSTTTPTSTSTCPVARFGDSRKRYGRKTRTRLFRQLDADIGRGA
ncbi:MAG: hypothetical protein LBF41_02985 [Deltaproteobacteria bacterium]|jgi:hypothetical protein|nr:hypothetical protein [Deltaproteobacteria bacterium]